MNDPMPEIRFPFSARSQSPDPAPEAEEGALATMAEQIRELDRAAERASARIQEAARELRQGAVSARSATRADLLAGLGSALVDRTEEIREDCRRLSELMERTSRLVAERDARERETTPAPQPAPPSQPAPEPRPAPERAIPVADIPPEPQRYEATPEPAGLQPADSEPRSGPSDRRQPQRVSEGVRLIATQMAIAGSSRTEIERRLRSQFGVADADVALDDIFGSRESEVR